MCLFNIIDIDNSIKWERYALLRNILRIFDYSKSIKPDIDKIDTVVMEIYLFKNIENFLTTKEF